MKYAYNPEPVQHDHRVPISVVPSQTRSRNAPLSLPLAVSTTGRFSRRSTFAAGSRLPTPAFGARNRGERSEDWSGVNPPTTSGRPDLERVTESTSIARVGTVDQSYERGRRSPLRVVGELTRVAAADDPGSGAGTSTGSRVEEKLKRMREKRRDLERA